MLHPFFPPELEEAGLRRAAGALTVLCLAGLCLPVAAGAVEPAVLEGTVRGADGEPQGGAVVVAVAEGCAAGGDGCPEAVGTTSDEDGVWELEGLAPGAYHVHVADPGGAHADQWWDRHVDPVDTVELTAGDARGGLDVTLAPAAVVAGRVLDADGRPVAGARASTTRTPFSEVEDTTGADGRFELPGLAGRAYDLEVSPPVAGLGAAAATVVVAGGAIHDIEVTLPLLGLEVLRVAGPDRVATAVAASREAFTEADAVVLASAGSFPDALAAAPLAAALDAPLLLTGATLPGAVAEEIRRLGASEAVVVGAVGAVPLVVQEEVRRLGVEVRRFAGETRFDTAALLGVEVGEPGGEVVLASGGAFPDALSVAPLAAVEGLPILLSASSSLVGDTAEAVAALAPERVLVVGGTAAISAAVTDQLPPHRRLAGPERYATSVAVARDLLERGGVLGTVYAATGHDFPDALAAGPVAARTSGPVLLVDGRNPAGSPATLEFLRAQGQASASLWVFGGTAAVSDATVQALVQARGQP